MGCERARERAPAHTWEVVRTQTTRETPSLSLSPPPPPSSSPSNGGKGEKPGGGREFRPPRRAVRFENGRRSPLVAALPIYFRIPSDVRLRLCMYCVCSGSRGSPSMWRRVSTFEGLLLRIRLRLAVVDRWLRSRED